MHLCILINHLLTISATIIIAIINQIEHQHVCQLSEKENSFINNLQHKQLSDILSKVKNFSFEITANLTDIFMLQLCQYLLMEKQTYLRSMKSVFVMLADRNRQLHRWRKY